MITEIMRNYSAIDLLRFARFKEDNPSKKPMDLIKEFNVKYPELSSKEKLINLSKAMNINNLHKALTGKDIDKEDEFFKSWNP